MSFGLTKIQNRVDTEGLNYQQNVLNLIYNKLKLFVKKINSHSFDFLKVNEQFDKKLKP